MSVFVLVREITQMVLGQQKLADSLYQDAIEANYSHEQMTPLNCILGNSKVVQNRLMRLEDTPTNRETFKLAMAIHQSAFSMWYYNQNQICRMKIQKCQFKFNASACIAPEHHVEKVLYPFVPQMLSRSLHCFICRASKLKKQMVADWEKYAFVLFNIV